ncbi:hypothetical protein M0R19_03745 [Candidatus Pacearchaeota archaeon]|nr:hypothetical protein [Candidatus Pacearchaeota archaeon]
MILTGKMYTYKPKIYIYKSNENENNVYFHLEIDKNWFITNILSNIPQCSNCNNINKNSCLFLYSCKFKNFFCVPLVSLSQENFKLIKKLGSN